MCGLLPNINNLRTGRVRICFPNLYNVRKALLCNAGKLSGSLLVFICDVQEVAALQRHWAAAQKELKKTQQLLRQLERQLAKAHMTRKESASSSQQLQVGLNSVCLSLCSADQLT